MSEPTTDLTVRKHVTVRIAPEDAFDLFTTRIGAWWPTRTHATRDDVEDVVFEPRVGGEVYEVAADGARVRWATVRAYDRPHRVLLEWHVDTPAPPFTEVEVLFAREGDGTRVGLEHRGWERLADRGAERAASYDEGWGVVLGKFADVGQPTSIFGE